MVSIKPGTRHSRKNRSTRFSQARVSDLGQQIGEQLGIIDAGARPGTTTAEAARLGELEREVRELRRANAILLSASVFFAAALDRPSR